MKTATIAFLFLFLSFSLKEDNTQILNQKYPVVISINQFSQKNDLILILTLKLKEKKYSIVSEDEVQGLIQSAAVQQANRDKDIINGKTDPVAYAKKAIQDMPSIAQRLIIKVIQNDPNQNIDSCYFAVRPVPALKVTNDRTHIADSIINLNDLSKLADAIISLSTPPQKNNQRGN